jgi:hypothetical protein
MTRALRQFVALVLLACAPAWAQSGGGATGEVWMPAKPIKKVDVTMPDVTGWTTTSVGAGQLQTEINNASCSPQGTILELAAGSTHTLTLSLPNKTCAAGKWIIIRTATAGNYSAEGTRLDPTLYTNLAKIHTTGSNAITTADSANSYRFIGVEIGYTDAVTSATSCLVRIFSVSATRATLPHHIIFDRVYFRGTPRASSKCAVEMNGNYIAVIDSYASEFHTTSPDAQVFAARCADGPFFLRNNYGQGSDEGFLFGGGDCNIDGAVPSDIEVDRSHFHKPTHWLTGAADFWGGTAWSVKNGFECKDCKRLLVRRSLFEGSWIGTQSGTCANLKSSTSGGVVATGSLEELIFEDSICRSTWAGLVFTGKDTSNFDTTTWRTTRVWVRHILFEGCGGGSADFILQLLGAPNRGVTIERVTAACPVQFRTMTGSTPGVGHLNWRIRDSIFRISAGGLGFRADGQTEGNNTLGTYLPGVSFTANALIGMASGSYTNYSGNSFPAAVGDVFTDANCGAVGANCTPISPTYDGKGADVTRIPCAAGSAVACVAQTYAALHSVTSVAPTNDVCNGSNTVAIAGTNFQAGVQVFLDGVYGTSVVDSGTQITFTLPTHAAGGPFKLAVINYGRTGGSVLTFTCN